MRFSKSLRRFLRACALGLALAAAAVADTITLAGGKTIADVTIVDETLKEVSFKQDGKTKTVASDSVFAVEYSKKPKLVEQADAAASDGDVAAARKLFLDFLGGRTETKDAAWAPAYAMDRLIQLASAENDNAGVVLAAQRLIEQAPQSRYVPAAMLARAMALGDDRKSAEALAEVSKLRKLIEDKALGPRWKLEADLAQTICDPALAGSKRRERAIEIAAAASSEFKSIADRARVVEGESHQEGESKDFAAAKLVFEQILADAHADPQARAGAWTGFADGLLAQAQAAQKAALDAAALLESAAETYMRVVVLCPEAARYRAKSMFLAGTCFELRADEASRARARQIYRSLMREYKPSKWAGDARKLIGG